MTSSKACASRDHFYFFFFHFLSLDFDGISASSVHDLLPTSDVSALLMALQLVPVD